MKFILINQFAPPAHAPTGILLSDLAETLRARGHEVEVICSDRAYGRATGLVAKLIEYTGFYAAAHRRLQRMNPPPDAVVSMTTPPFIGLTAAALKKKKNVPFMLWCMDLYPEALAAGGLLEKDGLLYRLLVRFTEKERDLADCIVTLGPDMSRVRSDCNVLEVPVWSRLKLSPESEKQARALRRERGWADDETICLYSGNMGRAHRVDEFSALAGLSIPKVRFVFCGTGPSKREWKEQVGDRFEWIDPVADDQLTAHLLSADIHLISQQP
ncbi:MAG TPA: glycosyltransferase family 4 protein, partial [Tichowtungia sp.]|nr:glycosyltransferase family 4 protein [Tichowtungia sp.]